MSLLKVDNLHTYFETDQGLVKAVQGVSFELERGRTLGIVGESGSGKSQTAMSILRLFEDNQKIYDGSIQYNGQELTTMSEKELRDIRGNEISMIFQEPMTSLNPVFTVKKQLNEAILLHQDVTKKEASELSLQMLEAVRINDPKRILNSYPFQLSGGMSQRVMIAMALACNPKMLIADEPTTALDVIIQADILKLMNDLKHDLGTSIIFISHDLGVVSQMADDVIVMIRGKIVEKAPIEKIFKNPIHPYTRILIAAFMRTDINSDKNDNKKLDYYVNENEKYDFKNFRENGEADSDWLAYEEDHFVAVNLK